MKIWHVRVLVAVFVIVVIGVAVVARIWLWEQLGPWSLLIR